MLVFWGYIIASVIADVWLLVPALLAGGLSRNWLSALISGTIVGGLVFFWRDYPSDHIILFIISVIGGAVISGVCFGVKRQWLAD